MKDKQILCHYDTIIIGAGIAGACSAYALSQKGHNVLVLEKNEIASGGSGAAGAFVSPKIGKGSPLQKLTNDAFSFAKDFYLLTCPKYFHQTGVIRIPKDEEDAKKFFLYEKFNENRYENYNKSQLEALGIKSEFESFYFSEAGVCDAKEICEYLLKEIEIEVVKYELTQIEQEDGLWCVGKYKAQNLVLATGYKNSLLDMRYMGIKGTWGSRGDYYSAFGLDVSMHKSISVSANVHGIIKIGATHVKSKNPCIACDGEPLKGLFESASQMIDTSDLRHKETFCGMRSGSKDYFPVVGQVIDVPFMLAHYPTLAKGAKPTLRYRKNLYVCNGLGGRGFVFAPLMAEILAEYIIEGKDVDVRVDPDRLFLKWCRRSPELDYLR